MEKFKSYILGVAVVAMAILGGCTKTPPAPTNSRETVSNNVLDGLTKVTVRFTVRVVERNRAGKVTGLEGARVIVSQGQGVDRQEVTTNADGHANFTTQLGDIEVYVDKGATHARVNNKTVVTRATFLDDYPNTDTDHDVEYGNSMIVELPTLNGGVRGIAFLSDPANDKKVAANVSVVYELANKSIQPNEFVVKANGDGLFEFTKLPVGETGTIRIDTMTTLGGTTDMGGANQYVAYRNTTAAVVGRSGTFTDLGAVAVTAENYIFAGTLVGRIVKPADPTGPLAMLYTNAMYAGVVASNVKVKLTYTAGLPAPFKSVWETTTGADGKFTFANVPATDGSNGAVTAKLSASVIYTVNVTPMNLPAYTLDIPMALSNNTIGAGLALQDPFPAVGTVLIRKGGTTNHLNGADHLLAR